MMEITSRDRTWRRARNSLFKCKNPRRNQPVVFRPALKGTVMSKRWKDMYIRSEKIRRAKQLGFEYPVISKSQQLLHAANEYMG